MGQKKTSASSSQLATSRKARFNYEILETYEAGLVLLGTEIKSLRDHGGTIDQAYVRSKKGELWLINAHIAPYSFGNRENHEEMRERKLLMHRREILKIEAQLQEKGLTIVPLGIYLSRGRAKLKIGLGRGKKSHDKRQTIKERDEKRRIDQIMKNG